jgi:hypothetical protein
MGDRSYVDCIVDAIEEKVADVLKKRGIASKKPVFKVRRYYEHSTRVDGRELRIKDLSILGDLYDVPQIMLVDNLASNFAG